MILIFEMKIKPLHIQILATILLLLTSALLSISDNPLIEMIGRLITNILTFYLIALSILFVLKS